MTISQPRTSTPEQWIAELEAAGWTKYMSTVWKSPNGFYYRGPFHAWQIMKQEVYEDGRKSSARIYRIVRTDSGDGGWDNPVFLGEVSMASYLICYQRCDSTYETVPHIHTEDGIFTVDSELDALGKKAIILNDLPSIARVNGECVVLQQTCGSCHTCFVGSQNFHYCPNCRHVLIHQVEPSEAEYWRSIAQTLGFQFCELKKAARLLIDNLPDGEYQGLGELRIALSGPQKTRNCYTCNAPIGLDAYWCEKCDKLRAQ